MRFLLTLLCALALQAQPVIVARVDSGALKCGALKRSSSTVQVYCYVTGADNKLKLVRNGIWELPAGGGAPAVLEYGGDVVLWYFGFDAAGGVIYRAIAGTFEPSAIADFISGKVANIAEAGYAEVSMVTVGTDGLIIGRLATFTAAAEGSL
jgi:hypothetical protein